MSDIGNGRAGHADVVIVGGGSAGAVLAARLSEHPALRVLGNLEAVLRQPASL